MFPFGAHACVVDVDVETGKVKVVRLGVGRRLRAGDQPDADRRPGPRRHRARDRARRCTSRSSTTRRASSSPARSSTTRCRPRPSCPRSRPIARRRRRRSTRLGVKGVGEAGTIAATPAVTAAVLDALEPLGVTWIDMPLTPMRVWEAIHGDGPAATEQGKARRARQGSAGSASVPGRRWLVIPAEFDYQRVGSVDDAIAALDEGGEDAKLLAGGHSLDPADEAAPGRAVAADRRGRHRGAAGRRALERRLADRRPHHPRRPPGQRGAGRDRHGRVADRRPAGAQPRHDRRLARARRPGVRPARRCCWPPRPQVTAQGSDGERTIAAADLFQDYLTTALEPGEVLTDVHVPALDGWTAGAMRSSPAAPRTGRWSASWALVKASDGTCEDVRVGLTHMGSTPLRATAVEEALRGQPLDAEQIASGRRAGRRRHRARRAT